jgi:hypothetical protein
MSLGLSKYIEKRIHPEPNTGCWLWEGHLRDGYGKVKVRGVVTQAHRTVYELLRGPIPEGKQCDHLCRVRCCVNPDHIEPVVQRVNALRGVGIGAINSKRIVCTNGHPFEGHNLITRKGRRYCRRCMNDAKLQWQRNRRKKV